NGIPKCNLGTRYKRRKAAGESGIVGASFEFRSGCCNLVTFDTSSVPIMSLTECTHLDQINDDVVPSANGCEECLKIGSPWVHLRLCLTCGHVGCCDSSPNRHATKHFHATAHPIMRSVEPGEDWGWCFVDEMEVNID